MAERDQRVSMLHGEERRGLVQKVWPTGPSMKDRFRWRQQMASRMRTFQNIACVRAGMPAAGATS